MKKEIRVLGIDDGSFSRKDNRVPIVGVMLRGNSYLEGVFKTEVDVDGTDATDILSTLICGAKYRGQLRAMLLDGIALGGFNIVDIYTLSTNTGIPVITVTRDKPDFKKIKAALMKHFDDWEHRWALVSAGKMARIEEPYPIYIKYAGITFESAKQIIKLFTIRGAVPEPLRIAHLIATGITRGESYGRA